ncbi:MAG: hypothetical protein AB7P03_12815 [Kofleriaceae bacterium]
MNRPARASLAVIALIAAACGDRDARIAVVIGSDASVRLRAVPIEPEPAPPAERPCLTDAEIADALKPVQHSLDGAPELRNVALVPEPASDTCWKRAFRRGSYRLLVYRKHDGKVAGKAGPERIPPSRACIEDAMRQVVKVTPYAMWLIERHEQADPDAGDLELGWPTWIECDGSRARPASISTWLHEATHAGRRGPCLADPLHKGERCIEAGQLPNSEIAALSPAELRRVPREARQALNGLQQIYFSGDGRSLLTILDEVTAYAIDADVQASQLEQRIGGPIHLLAQPRQVLAAPMFLYLAARYFASIERAGDALTPALGGAIVSIFDDANVALERWQRALTATGNRPTRAEAWAIERYRATAKRALGKWQSKQAPSAR